MNTDSPAVWPYPGARWWKFDLHTHTPASKDTDAWQRVIDTPDQVTPEKWLMKYMLAGIDCVAVTDHNTGEWIDRLKQTYARLEAEKPEGFRPLFVFPALEISVNGGFHLLAIFDRDKSTSDIDRLLGKAEYQGTSIRRAPSRASSSRSSGSPSTCSDDSSTILNTAVAPSSRLQTGVVGWYLGRIRRHSRLYQTSSAELTTQGEPARSTTFEDISVETLAYRQASRNETITSLLAKCQVPPIKSLNTMRATLMDRRGEGVAIILDRSERLSGRRPVYELPDESELRLTIFAAGATEDSA